jgi:hypothetical protein
VDRVAAKSDSTPVTESSREPCVRARSLVPPPIDAEGLSVEKSVIRVHIVALVEHHGAPAAHGFGIYQ